MMDSPSASPTGDGLPVLAVKLLKGVLYQESDPQLWGGLLRLQSQVRDYVSVLGLELTLDEAEGYAFLRSRRLPEADDGIADPIPRLVARRPLSFPVSLLLALLRRKLAEADASGGDTRLVLTRDEIVEMVRVFLPPSSNEARVFDQLEAHLGKIVELGFLRRMKPPAGQAGTQPASYEVRRILKAFVDAQWLADFDTRLAAYRAQIGGNEDESG
jgi:hypothetical protein